MEHIKIIPFFILTALLSTGCNDDFLNLAPQDELSEKTIFSTYGNVKNYSISFYEFFQAYGGGARGNMTWRDTDADLIQNGGATTGRPYIWENYNIPTTSSTWTGTYRNIRKVNLMLDNIDNSNMSTEEIAHWRGIGLFFRAHQFFKLLKTYGGVPWLEHTVTDTDLDILYGARDTRDVVAENILRDLLEAVDTVKEDGDGSNTINANVVRALLSRFGLFEGTWRKYHALGDHEKYLNASIAASEFLVNGYPALLPNYDQVFNSDNLEGKNGILLYKHYVIDILTHNMSTNTRSTNNKFDITRKGIDKFLMKNGMPVRNPLSGFLGDKDAHAEFKNRDDRLLILTPPPYKVNGNGTIDKWTHTGNPIDQEYFSILEGITGGFPYKTLPDLNWSGRATGGVPNFQQLVPTQTGNGYRVWKIYNEHHQKVSSADINDAPIFRMGEILLNYAEAKFEMGQFTQTIADATISKLRARGDVVPMTVSAIGADFDPTRDPDVEPVLFEIRRERSVELMAEGFRREDLRRWKKMDYASVPKLGRWVVQSDYSKNIPIQNNLPEGYVQLVPDQAPAFPDYYYLFPLPSDEIVLNPQLLQNPKWQ